VLDHENLPLPLKPVRNNTHQFIPTLDHMPIQILSDEFVQPQAIGLNDRERPHSVKKQIPVDIALQIWVKV
jgi:hypothetical protein